MQYGEANLPLSCFMLQHGVTAPVNDVLRVLSKKQPSWFPEHDPILSENFLQLLLVADVDFGDFERYSASEPALQEHYSAYLAMVRRRLATPLSLQAVCVKRVRKCLGVPYLWKKIDALAPLPKPLPEALKLIR